MKQYFWKTSLIVTALFTTSIIAPKSVWAQNDYPEEIKTSFVDNCTQSGLSQGATIEQIEPICTCLINGIETEYTYQEFQAIEKQLQAGEQPPTKLVEIMSNCVQP